jgi:endonuclease YncB( thermonuclease family)
MRRLLCTVLALAFTAGLAGEAAARTGSCLVPGSTTRCKVWTGRVTSIDDGDTIRVDVAGDDTRAPIRVRLTGIQAMEQTVYSQVAARRRGECHALEATARLQQLLRRGRYRVRLSAQDPSSRSGQRWRRSVAVKLGKRWRDVGRILVSEGHALWLPNSAEYAWNAEYSRLAERAAAKHRNLWNPAYCGAGPSDASPLRLVVNSDADGSDSVFINGEWVRIRNLDPVHEVHVGGWWVRDSALRRYTFPDYTTLAPGESLTLYVGRGTNTWTEFYWGSRTPIFDNLGAHDMGDGAFLFDMQGDLRASMTYPCRTGCSDPNQGAIALSAHPNGREYVTLRNVSGRAVDLRDYRLATPAHGYAFDRDAVLAPGERMTVEVQGDPGQDSRLHKYWGRTGAILKDGGDTVRLATFRGVTIDCYAYGSGRC